MSIALVRDAMKRRVEALVAGRQFYTPDKTVRVPAVHRQFAPTENDGIADPPCVIVRVNGWKQRNGVRTATLTVVVVMFDDRDEQGYQAVENLLEQIELDVISNPWLDGGAYHLVEPFECKTAGMTDSYFGGTFECDVEIPAILENVGPDGKPMSEYI